MRADNLKEQIAHTRAARKRREVIGLVITFVTVFAVLVLLFSLPNRSPLLGTAVFGFAASNAVMRLFVEGRDDLQWHRAVVAFALGALVGLTSLVVDAAAMEVLDSEPNSPGFALGLTAVAWIVAEQVMRMQTGAPSDDDEEGSNEHC